MPNKIITSKLSSFETDTKKSGTLLSVIGCKIPALNFKNKIHTAIFKTGTITEANNKISPTIPTAFFIKTLLAIATLKPSDK